MATSNSKFCIKCNILLTDKNWPVYRKNKCEYICKKCHNDRIKVWKKNNKKKVKKWCKDYYLKNKDKVGEYSRWHHLKYRYGLSKRDYEILMMNQDSKCLICGKRKKKLVVDHCHKIEKIRGLLCKSCNTKLGWFEHYMYNILDYLKI